MRVSLESKDKYDICDKCFQSRRFCETLIQSPWDFQKRLRISLPHNGLAALSCSKCYSRLQGVARRRLRRIELFLEDAQERAGIIDA